ncbi:MAG: FtsX-like permease family protein [Candidatus Eisenbacteria bacterium]|uniref:ABC transporter permease n=1 Tax=Eiseniibacteriota bacterium TaxID=2212470 RepID=A0A956LVQ7_UNCEI|nr:ABC transporter permease [Candidatus Eisenbacteria bacterium]
MIGHYCRVVWNRKRANALILIEVLVSFLVLCVVFSIAVHYAENWRRPLGFQYRDLWSVTVRIPDRGSDPLVEARNLETSRALLAALRGSPEVESATPAPNAPYSGNVSRSGIYLADRKLVQFLYTPVVPGAIEVYPLELVAGRWLQPGDDVLDYTPIVISQNLARRIFGREDPLGRPIEEFDEQGQPRPRPEAWQQRKVVGVVKDFRKTGELSDTPYAAFVPQSMADATRSAAPWSYLVRLRPGTSGAFEESLLRSLRSVGPTWQFEIKSVARMRASYLKARLLPLLIGATIAGFLVLMVGMGLLGVLWQNVSGRTQEIGLRRALGATREQVRAQILGELVTLTLLALGLGVVLFLQVPLLGLVPFVEPQVFGLAALAAVVAILPFVLLCGLYPGWLATAVDPARALQYE